MRAPSGRSSGAHRRALLRGMSGLLAIVGLALLASCNVSRDTGTFDPPDSVEDAGEDAVFDTGNDTTTSDTGATDTGPMCGDGTCESGENCGDCPADCTCSNNRTCENDACLCAGDPCDGFGEACCSTGCKDLEVDKQNCGSCGNLCAASEDCQSGRCTCGAVACADGEACCGDACVDLTINTSHCGGCDNICNPGEVCVDGACVCDGGGGGDTACEPGNVCCNGVCCSSGEQCCSGTCALPSDPICECGSGGACTAAEICCPPGDAMATCYDPTTSAENCGACGNSCRADQVCDGSVCVCPSGERECNGECIPSGNCCSNDECAGDLVCAASGQCECPASSPKRCGSNSCIPATGCCDESECSGDLICADSLCACPSDRPIQCGADNCIASGCCDNGGCGGDLVCNNNTCECPGSAPKQCGSNTCIPNTGCCRTGECSGGKTCQNNQCACPTGETDCNGTCRDTDTNANHCGGCGNRCGANARCVGGQCQCNNGWGNCDGNFGSNGCEVDLTSTNNHCGSCGNSCGPPLLVCAESACSLGRYFEVTGVFNPGATPRVRVLRHPSLVIDAPSGGSHAYSGMWEDSNAASGTTTGSFTLAADHGVQLSDPNAFGHATGRGDLIVTTRDDSSVQAVWLRRGESGFSLSDLDSAWQNSAYIGLRSENANDGWVRGFRGVVWFDNGNITNQSNQKWVDRAAASNTNFVLSGSASIANDGAVTLSTNRGTWKGYLGANREVMLFVKETSGGAIEPAYMVMVKADGVSGSAVLDGNYFFSHLFGENGSTWGDASYNGSGGVTGGEVFDKSSPSMPDAICSNSTYSVDGGGGFSSTIRSGDCSSANNLYGRVQDPIGGLSPAAMQYDTSFDLASIVIWIRKQ